MSAALSQLAADHDLVVVEAPKDWAEFPVLKPLNGLPMRFVARS